MEIYTSSGRDLYDFILVDRQIAGTGGGGKNPDLSNFGKARHPKSEHSFNILISDFVLTDNVIITLKRPVNCWLVLTGYFDKNVPKNNAKISVYEYEWPLTKRVINVFDVKIVYYTFFT